MKDIGKKLCDDQEPIIDWFLVEIAKPTTKPLHDLGVTPNMITIFGLSLGLISIHFLIHNQYVLSFVFLWLTYWTDCLDGYFARKYNQVTRLGDYLDHFRDFFVAGSIVILILMKMKGFAAKISSAVIISIFAFMMCCYIGCQERLTAYTEHNDCLGFLGKLCGKYPEEEVKYTKYFGCGTFILVISVFILGLKAQM
jgi:phosphatidylglycerophosphate synthase